MKKVIVMMMAVMIGTFGFSFTANADCDTCCPPMTIDRGCDPGEQDAYCCHPFDFEDKYTGKPTYCEYDLKAPCEQKAYFEICQCLDIEGGPWAELVEGNVIDISMEILVNGVAGDNGVYWAEVIGTGGIPMDTYTNTTTACADDDSLSKFFKGDFLYRDADGTSSEPLTGNCDRTCSVPSTNQAVVIYPDPTQTGDHGYMITDDDEINKKDTWIIDIPYLRADPSKVTAGDVVQVKICLTKGLIAGGVCGECEGCCCIITIGTLCCEEVPGECCIYHPYVVANDPYGFWSTGIALTLMDSVAPADAVVTLTLTDRDGNVATCVKDDFTGRIWAGALDDLPFIGDFVSGPCLLEIVANSPIDSYCYLTGNGFFGAGTLARWCWEPWSSCYGVNGSN